VPLSITRLGIFLATESVIPIRSNESARVRNPDADSVPFAIRKYIFVDLCEPAVAHQVKVATIHLSVYGIATEVNSNNKKHKEIRQTQAEDQLTQQEFVPGSHHAKCLTEEVHRTRHSRPGTD
jgi:hypothetical protein